MTALDRMPSEQRRLLVRTAAAEFAAAGYQRASLNHIIHTCGLSKGSFYHRLDSKRELFDLVVHDLGGEFATAIDVPRPEAFVDGDFWADVTAMLERFLAASRTDPAYTALGRMFYLSDSPDDADGPLPDAMAAIADWIRRVLEIGRSRGAVRADLPVALQHRLVLSVLRATDEWAVTHSSESVGDPRATVDAVLALIRRMLDPARGEPAA